MVEIATDLGRAIPLAPSAQQAPDSEFHTDCKLTFLARFEKSPQKLERRMTKKLSALHEIVLRKLNPPSSSASLNKLQKVF